MSARQRRLKTADLEERAWTLYVAHGQTQAQIAAALGVHQTTVGKAIRRVEKRHRADFDEMRTRERSHQLARLDHIYREAIEGFERSKLPRPTKALRSANQASDTSPERPGDPRLLNVAMTALADKRKILGIEAPTRVQMTDTDRPLKDLTDAELEQELLATLAALRGKHADDK